MEAATAGKAIITTNDSGGVLGLVRHQETGWVASPEPADLADVMAQAVSNTHLLKNLGLAGRALWASMGATWISTVSRLVQ